MNRHKICDGVKTMCYVSYTMVPCEYLPTFKHFLSLITFHNKLQLPAILHPLTIDLNKHHYALLLLSPLVFLVLTL